MSSRLALAACGATLVAGAIAWLCISSRPQSRVTLSTSASAPSPSWTAIAVGTAAPASVGSPPPPSPLASPAGEEIVSLSPHLPVSGEMLPWEAAVKYILDSPTPPGVRAQALFGLLPRIPEEALATTTEQATAWLRDRDYSSTAAPLIENPATHGAILSAMFADLMERPDAVALPTLLAIAREPTHPFAAAARDNLSFLLGHNHGADWAAWERDIRQHLAEP